MSLESKGGPLFEQGWTLTGAIVSEHALIVPSVVHVHVATCSWRQDGEKWV